MECLCAPLMSSSFEDYAIAGRTGNLLKCSRPLALETIGRVPFRPLGNSHFTRAPWVSDSMIADDAYLPAVMTEKAMRLGTVKFSEPVYAISDSIVDKAQAYLQAELSSIWHGDNLIDYRSAVAELDLSKSPGFPYYYWSSDKEDALYKFGDIIQDKTSRLLAGEEVPCVFSFTLKDELRTRDRVLDEKTRVFCACDIHHLLASKMMFSQQNSKLMRTIGRHPVTIGIQVPGPQFVTAILSLKFENKGDQAYDGDIGGCDARFVLRIARVIRNLRKMFLPIEYHRCVDHIYNSVYCGVAVFAGWLYRVYHNKSGWENTGHDNSIYIWCMIYIAVTHLTQKPFNEVCKLKVNGDDLATAINHELIGIKDLAVFLRQFNVILETNSELPRHPSEITFLSHTIVERFVPGIGDFVIAAGNLPKLASSVHWVKLSPELSFEESCLAHLLGLRICLFPWPVEFWTLEEVIDSFLEKLTITTRLAELLKARLTERQIGMLHLRGESVTFFPASINLQKFNQVLKCVCGLIKNFTIDQTNATPKQTLEGPACGPKRPRQSSRGGPIEIRISDDCAESTSEACASCPTSDPNQSW